MNERTHQPGGSLLERATPFFAYSPPPAIADLHFDPLPDAEPPLPDIDHAPLPQFKAAAPAPAPAPAPPPRRKVIRGYAPIDQTLLGEQGLLIPGAPVTPLAEEFRLLKRQLLATARDVAGKDAARARMILVCSANPGDGKTFTATNLALSMAAERDVEILLVDADIAKPDILSRLGIGEGAGLLDAIAKPTIDIETCIIETDIPNLTVLPAGTRGHADTELLASERARTLIEGLVAADPRRIVLFDSPPALAASPAGVLATLVGQVLVVVRADRTTEADLREAVAQLDGCEHVQLMLNGVTLHTGGPRLGEYYGYGASE